VKRNQLNSKKHTGKTTNHGVRSSNLLGCIKSLMAAFLAAIFLLRYNLKMKASSKIEPVQTCTKCYFTKFITAFNFRNLAKNIRHSYCRECGRELTKSHYARNKQQYLEKNLRSFCKRREYVRKMKDRFCADCGIKYPYYVMDFDHREDEIKEFGLNSLSRITMNVLKREIDKCDVVCANCHRERTQQRRLSKMSLK